VCRIPGLWEEGACCGLQYGYPFRVERSFPHPEKIFVHGRAGHSLLCAGSLGRGRKRLVVGYRTDTPLGLKASADNLQGVFFIL